MRKLFAIILLALITSCSLNEKEIGRLTFDKVSIGTNFFEKSVTFKLKKNDVVNFWSEMDVKYSGNVKFQFQILIDIDEKRYGRFKIDPMQKTTTIGEIKTVVDGNVNWSFTGKNMDFKIPKDGTYTFRGVFMVNTDRNYKVEKAELVIKK